MNEEEKPLTVTAAARLAGMTIEGIRKAIRRGKLKAVVVATRPVYGVRHEDLASYLESVE